MNKDQFEKQWQELKVYIRDKWSNLTDEDIRQINGRYDQLVSKIQQREGLTRDQAEEEVRTWYVENNRGQGKTYVREEDWRAKKEDNHSFLKGLLLAGLPLLLLAGYLASENSKLKQDAYTRATDIQEVNIARETAADRRLTDVVRRTLLNNQDVSRNGNIIQIESNDGVVTVSGTAANNQQRDLILKTASETPGVKQINNQLVAR